ncbi:thioredoxin fold domain-containing protein [Aureivirga sp. CE67]|uniref:thioredoxin fold domain-containing protein n=1 Tax=Aureivirga sp. CE67 TaxID=1788983 RepID=UPI0018C8F574|nr:thioredoxin fold domain-containing protein [Aureivirga sp. CE67]
MKKILFTFFISFTIISFAQNTKNFESIANKEISTEVQDLLELKQNLKYFIGKDGIDEIDVEIMSNQGFFSMILMNSIQNKEENKKLTYQVVLESFVEFKTNEGYQNYKTIYPFLKEIESRPADIKNWENDKLLFEKIGLQPIRIEKIHEYLKENSNPNITYKEFMESFNQKEKAETTVNQENIELNLDSKNIGYAKYLEESKQIGKPLLLYFTGHACVNCKKMESSIFREKMVYKTLFNDYIFVSLYVDERTKLPENLWKYSEFTKRNIDYIGAYNSEIQMKKFQTNAQPYFIILNENNEKIDSMFYTDDENEFLNFLNKGLEKHKN